MSIVEIGVLLGCFAGFALFGGAAVLDSPDVKLIDTPVGFWRSLSSRGKKLYAVAVVFWGGALAMIVWVAFG